MRYYRNQSTDPERGGKLTQERLAELLDMEGVSYTGAAISDWERGKTRINIEDRLVLLALIQVLAKCGGIRSPMEANDLLENGNYRSLALGEQKQIFPHIQDPAAPALPGKEWSRWLLDGMAQALGGWTSADVVRAVLWVVLWYGLWQLISPLMNWPLKSPSATWYAGVLAAGASFLAPILVGTLTSTRTNPFWLAQGGASDPRLRWLTYLGAGAGFVVGYLGSFMVVILLYNLQLIRPGSTAAALTAFTSLLLSAAAARQIPVNHLRAYGNLAVRPAMILAAFIFIGPLWSFYLTSFASVLLSPPVGAFFLLAVIILVAATSWKRKSASFRQ